jgi:hypothetical protein
MPPIIRIKTSRGGDGFTNKNVDIYFSAQGAVLELSSSDSSKAKIWKPNKSLSPIMPFKTESYIAVYL